MRTAFGVSRLLCGRLGSLRLLVKSHFTSRRVCRRQITRSPGFVASTTLVGGLGSKGPVLVCGLHGRGDPGVVCEETCLRGATVEQDGAGRGQFRGPSHLLADDLNFLVEEGCGEFGPHVRWVLMWSTQSATS
jgi:hypothetical protein